MSKVDVATKAKELRGLIGVYWCIAYSAGQQSIVEHEEINECRDAIEACISGIEDWVVNEKGRRAIQDGAFDS